MKAAEFARLVKNARRRADGEWWDARCPAHDDRRESLSFADGDDGLIVKCHAGCTVDAITGSRGLTVAQLFHANGNGHRQASGRARIVTAYDYRDERGAVLYQVVRLDPKDFRQRRPDPAGVDGWTWSVKGVRRVVYRLDELAEVPRVYHVEGEKDADALVAVGLRATTTPGGADAWRDEYADQVKAAGVPEVVLLPDHDDAGEQYAAKAARAYLARGVRVKRVRLPGLPPKGDASDWLAAGGTAAALETLADAAPELTPADVTTPEPSAEADTWPPLEPVPDDLPPVPAFDAALLPAPLRPWVLDVAERAQCPVDYVAVGVVVSMGAVVGRQVTIRPKQQDDWTVVPNLWGVGIGRPGLMKTAAMQEAQRGIRRLIADAREAYRAALAEYEFQVVAAKARREAVQDKLKAAAKRGEPTEALREEFEAARVPEAPVERRYLVNDATVEKLGALLNLHPNGLLLFRDELGGFLATLDREGHENDRGFYCEAWNGTGSYTYDRIARGTLHIEAACVSILGGIQPLPLATYLRDAFTAGQDDGLIQRFQLMVWPDLARAWRNVDRWPDSEARRRVVELFQALDRLDARALAAHHDDDGRPFLRFTPEAQACFDAWRADLERRLRDEDEHPVLVSHLAKYRSLVPSLALLFHLAECVDRGTGGPVSAAATACAVAWTAYLEPHARRVYAGVTDAGRQAAAMLARKLQTGALVGPFTVRDVYRKQWTGLDRVTVPGALDRLEALGWVRPVRAPRGQDGGRPTTLYHVNPAARGPA